jgi:hypothetical protein
MRFHIEDVIMQICDLDEQYEDLIHDGIISGPHNDYVIERIEELEGHLWDLPMSRSDLEWLANRPITGTNRIGDPYYSQKPGELGDRQYDKA